MALSIALTTDLSPPRPWEWLHLDLSWWQELVDARNAFDEGRDTARAIYQASKTTQERTKQHLAGGSPE